MSRQILVLDSSQIGQQVRGECNQYWNHLKYNENLTSSETRN